MQYGKLKYLVFALIFGVSINVSAQTPNPGNIDDFIIIEVDDWDPIYKPVIGFGVGAFNYYGEIQNPNQTPFNGELGYKINVSTYIDKKHHVKGNFYAIAGGYLSGNERSYLDTALNMNFRSSVLVFGFNLDYDFDKWIAPSHRLRPFVSIGAEMVTFNTKTDLSAEIEGAKYDYHYWNDGSIRSERASDNPNANLLRRDFIYETDIQAIDYGLDDYAQYALAIPAEIGLDFQVTNRVMFKIASSAHYTLSDEIDHVSSKNQYGRIGNAQHDWFTYSYFTIHLDLFSSDKTLTAERLYYELDLDLTMIGDEDGDGYFDAMDKCPGTPFGIEVDTAGCPLDSDLDRVLDYLDDEPNSRYGAYVDERGVEMSEEDVIASLDMSEAVNRADISKFIRTPDSYSHYNKSSVEIPAKFMFVDKDKDGYITYDEMMDAIDEFFEFESDLTTDDIHELNNFFFTQ